MTDRTPAAASPSDAEPLVDAARGGGEAPAVDGARAPDEEPSALADRPARPSAGGTPPRRAVDDEPVLPDRAAEDRPEAWGERTDERDDDHYLRERPPHW